MKVVSNRKRWQSPVTRRIWYLPKTSKDIILSDAIFAIEEMMWLKHSGAKLCEGCREIQGMLKRINEFLDMTANGSDLIWPALRGKRVMQLFTVKTKKNRGKKRG